MFIDAKRNLSISQIAKNFGLPPTFELEPEEQLEREKLFELLIYSFELARD